MDQLSLFAGKKVLTVDDSRAIRVLIVQMLTSKGAEVLEAGSGAEALQLLEQGMRFDVILLDLVLPDTDGVQLLRRVRANDKEAAVVMLTGLGSIQSATASVRQGADGYVEKQHLVPGGDEGELIFAIQQAVEHRAGLVAREQLEKVKAEFYSIVTHDLRTPAGNIATSLRLLSAGKDAPSLSPQQQKLLEVARNSANKMLTLINNFLDFSQIEAGFLKLDKAERDIGEVLRASVEQAEPQAAAHNQTLALSEAHRPAPANIDAARLEQVFDNLLSNAIKYTPDGGRIDVKMEVDDRIATIRVKDTGRGIAPDRVSALFTKYNRIPGEATRGVAGTGLGLVTVKEIVEAHGGTVHADSEGRDRGSMFVVTLPLEQGSTEQV